MSKPSCSAEQQGENLPSGPGGSRRRYWLVELPSLLFLPAILFLLVAMGIAWLSAPDDAASIGWVVLLIACYLSAGLAWGLRRFLCRVGWDVHQQVTACGRRQIDQVLQSLLERAPLAEQAIELAQIRQRWEQLGVSLLSAPGDQNASCIGWLWQRLVSWLLHCQWRILRGRLEAFLQVLEQQGATQLSADVLKDYLLDQLAAGVTGQVRGQLAVTSGLLHATVLAMTVVPLLVARGGV